MFSVTCLGFLLAYNALGIQPFRRGFFCDDQSISYPYYSDTVSDEMATLICIIIPGLFVRIMFYFYQCYIQPLPPLGEAKASCILRHRGVQLILAYSWARPAILAAVKGRGGMFFLFLLFLHFHSCSSFFPVPLFHLLCLFSLFLWETTQNDPQGLTCR